MTNLKRIRMEKRIRLREIAKFLGITPQTVQQMERIGIRKVETAKRYGAALNVSWNKIIEQ